MGLLLVAFELVFLFLILIYPPRPPSIFSIKWLNPVTISNNYMPNRTQGRVQVQIDKKGYLTFKLPMAYALKYYGKKQKYFSFGAKYTEEDKALAITAAAKMQKALEAEEFNPDNITIYKHSSKQIKG
jgi:hypothetical protein